MGGVYASGQTLHAEEQRFVGVLAHKNAGRLLRAAELEMAAREKGVPIAVAFERDLPPPPVPPI